MVYSQKTIGTNIRNSRKSIGLSMDQLAELIDISGSFLGLVERGQRGLGIEKICRLTEIFEISLDDLFSEKGAYKKSVPSKMCFAEDSIVDRPKNYAKLQSLLYSLDEEEINMIIAQVAALRKYRKSIDEKERTLKGKDDSYKILD